MIRKFEQNDIDHVMRIWESANRSAHDFIPEEYWKENHEFVKDALPQAEVYVYIRHGHIAGFIGTNGNHIEGIFVDRADWNRGIGTALLNQVMNEKAHLTLNVYQKNTNAIRFYEKNGFTVTKESIDEETGETEYTMTWNA